ncbi:MAG: hypothetical protein WCC84_05890 [Candidatus Cybelea sp.]
MLAVCSVAAALDLYVAHSGRHRFRGLLSVLTFPQGKLVSTIPITRFATGICSGNVVAQWRYPAGGKRIKTVARYEYGVSGLAISVK